MLSTLVLASPQDGPGTGRTLAPLLRTLSALVPIAVEGVVRDVTVLTVGDGGDVAAIADEAGCGLVQASTFDAAVAQGVAGARASWLCILQAGVLLGRDFAEDVAGALDADTTQALLLRGQGGRFGRLFPSLAAVTGIVTPRDRLQGRSCASFGDLLRHVRPARTLFGQVAMVA